MNQDIIGRKPKYVQMFIWRLNRWREFMEIEFNIEFVEAVEPIHDLVFTMSCHLVERFNGERFLITSKNIVAI
ncbi:hypothetical protein [Rummeliibacillus pycnus]|uniref:hypothetical protein n=1 Tax=Rummeliibacillus pycnus TaxID=101070 RepID=UPI003D287370